MFVTKLEGLYYTGRWRKIIVGRFKRSRKAQKQKIILQLRAQLWKDITAFHLQLWHGHYCFDYFTMETELSKRLKIRGSLRLSRYTYSINFGPLEWAILMGRKEFVEKFLDWNDWVRPHLSIWT